MLYDFAPIFKMYTEKIHIKFAQQFNINNVWGNGYVEVNIIVKNIIGISEKISHN